MNLTHFINLEGTGRQLIVLQLHSEDRFRDAQVFVDDLKKKNWIDPSAYILKAETYTYHLEHANQRAISSQYEPYFQMLSTSSFTTMSTYIQKWKKSLPLYRDIVPIYN